MRKGTNATLPKTSTAVCDDSKFKIMVVLETTGSAEISTRKQPLSTFVCFAVLAKGEMEPERKETRSKVDEDRKHEYPLD